MTILKKIFLQLKNPNFRKAQKIKSWHNAKTQIMTKIKLWQKSKLNSWQLNFWQNFEKSFGKNNLTPRQPMRCTLGSILRFCDVLFTYIPHIFTWLERQGPGRSVKALHRYVCQLCWVLWWVLFSMQEPNPLNISH